MYPEQAENRCRQFLRAGKPGIVNVYRLNETAAADCSVLHFPSLSGEWPDFISLCRQGKDRSSWEIVAGGIIEDRIFNTAEVYFAGLKDRESALRDLSREKPNYRIAFRTRSSIDRCLTFERSYSI